MPWHCQVAQVSFLVSLPSQRTLQRPALCSGPPLLSAPTSSPCFCPKAQPQELPLGRGLEPRLPKWAERPGIPPKWARQDQTVQWGTPAWRLEFTPARTEPYSLSETSPKPFMNHLGPAKCQGQRLAFPVFSASWLWSLSWDSGDRSSLQERGTAGQMKGFISLSEFYFGWGGPRGAQLHSSKSWLPSWKPRSWPRENRMI